MLLNEDNGTLSPSLLVSESESDEELEEDEDEDEEDEEEEEEDDEDGSVEITCVGTADWEEDFED